MNILPSCYAKHVTFRGREHDVRHPFDYMNEEELKKCAREIKCYILERERTAKQVIGARATYNLLMNKAYRTHRKQYCKAV